MSDIIDILKQYCGSNQKKQGINTACYSGKQMDGQSFWNLCVSLSDNTNTQRNVR